MGHAWALPDRQCPALRIARLLTVGVYLGVLAALALWLSQGTALTHGWQALLLLLAAGVMIAGKSRVQTLIEGWLYPVAVAYRREGIGHWLRLWATPPADPVASLPQALCEALDLSLAAVALPVADGWRIAHCQGDASLIGRHLPDPAPGEARFLRSLDGPLAAVAGGVRLHLDDRIAVLVLLGARRTGEPLTETDLQVAELLLAAVAGMVGYAQSQVHEQRAEAELQRLFAYVAALQAAMRGRHFGDQTAHELRSALTLIVGHAELLLDGVYGAIDDRQHDQIAAIHRQAETLITAIGTPAPSGRRTVDLQDEVQAVLAAWHAALRAKDLQVQTDLTAVSVLAEPAGLRRMLQQLIDRAIAGSDSHGVLRVTSRVLGASAVLAIDVAPASAGTMGPAALTLALSVADDLACR